MPEQELKIFSLSEIENPELGRYEESPWPEHRCDSYSAMLVAAKDEEQAREAAAQQAGDEGSAAWVNPNLTRCLLVANDAMVGNPSVLVKGEVASAPLMVTVPA